MDTRFPDNEPLDERVIFLAGRSLAGAIADAADARQMSAAAWLREAVRAKLDRGHAADTGTPPAVL